MSKQNELKLFSCQQKCVTLWHINFLDLFLKFVIIIDMKVGIFVLDFPPKKMDEIFSSRKEKWGSPCEVETHKRIKVALAAYAYEILNDSFMNDSEFDELAKSIDLNIATKRPDLDEWFKSNFQADTGMWIHNHPELDKIGKLYRAQKT